MFPVFSCLNNPRETSEDHVVFRFYHRCSQRTFRTVGIGADRHPCLVMAVSLPLWTDNLGPCLAEYKNEKLWRQGSPSANPAKFPGGHILTSPSLSFLTCQTGIVRTFPSPSAEWPVPGKCSVKVSSSSSLSSFWGSQSVTSQRPQITQVRPIFGPQFTPLFPIVHLTEHAFK